MTRITDTIQNRNLMDQIFSNKEKVSRYSDEVSSGVKVNNPGDSNYAATIAQFQEGLNKVETYKNRITSVKSALTYQDDIMSQVSDLLIRAQEIAEQAANGTNSNISRAQMAEEVFQIRDHIASLANSKYQGRYIYGGTDDDDPPYDAATYVDQVTLLPLPATGGASQRYVFDAETGTGTNKVVNITDNLSVTTTSTANLLFDNAIQGTERLARAMAGYATNPAAGTPDGTGRLYVFPADYTNQTDAIRGALDQLDIARERDVMIERDLIGGKLRRLETAESLLSLSKDSAQEALNKYQNADISESASLLAQAQTSLQASFTVSAKVMNLSILNYL